MIELRPYQRQAANWLAPRLRGILALDPGLGKTRVALTAAGDRPVYVIAPASVREHWQREASALGLDDPRVESYQRIVVNEAARREFERPAPNAVLVIDELHYLKHHASGRTRRLYHSRSGLVRNFGTVWGLSGTPMPRNPMDLYPYLAAQWPRLLAGIGITTSDAFMNRFCSWYMSEYGPKVVGCKAAPALRELLSHVMLRMATEDVAPDLPPLRFDIEVVTAPGSLVESVWDATAEITGAGPESAPVPYSDPRASVVWHKVGDAKVPAALEIVTAWLDDTDAPIVLFAHHHSVLDALQVALTDYGVRRIDGNVSPGGREAAIDALYRSEARVLLAQTGAVGTGFDGLQRVAYRALLVEPEWDSSLNVQAAHRLARLGQTMPVEVTMLSLADTIDEALVRQYHREAQMRREIIG